MSEASADLHEAEAALRECLPMLLAAWPCRRASPCPANSTSQTVAVCSAYDMLSGLACEGERPKCHDVQAQVSGALVARLRASCLGALNPALTLRAPAQSSLVSS